MILCCMSLLSGRAGIQPNLYRSVDKVRMEQWVDSVFDAFGDNTVTAGIAIENHGTIENCTFEGTLAGGSTSASKAVLAGLVANNFGTIRGGTAVADGLIFAAESGKTDAVGIAVNEDETASVENSNAVAAIRAYGGASGTLGGAVGEDNAGTGNRRPRRSQRLCRGACDERRRGGRGRRYVERRHARLERQRFDQVRDRKLCVQFRAGEL